MNTVNVKSAKSKERDKRIKPDYSALGYQTSFKRLLAGISIMLNSLQFRSRIKCERVNGGYLPALFCLAVNLSDQQFL